MRRIGLKTIIHLFSEKAIFVQPYLLLEDHVCIMTGLLYCQIYSIQTNMMVGDCMRGRFDGEEKWVV